MYMQYDYNRAAFRSVAEAPDTPVLVGAYCSCVLLELSLKQYLSSVSVNYNLGHDLASMLHYVAIKQGTSWTHTPLVAFQAQIRNALTKLATHDKSGTATYVRGNMYPDMRYCRHQEDWTIPHSTDDDIRTLLGVLGKTIDFIRRRLGISV